MARDTKRARREALVAKYRRCGKNQRTFAEKHGIHPTTFSGWLRRVRGQEGKGTRKTTGGFAELVTVDGRTGATETEWPCSLEVSGFTFRFRQVPAASWVAEVLRGSVS